MTFHIMRRGKRRRIVPKRIIKQDFLLLLSFVEQKELSKQCVMTVLKDKQKLGVRASESYPFHHISGIKRILDLMLGYQSRLDLFPTHRGWRLMIIFGKSCVHLFVSCIFCGRSRSFISFFFGSVAEAFFLLLCPP